MRILPALAVLLATAAPAAADVDPDDCPHGTTVISSWEGAIQWGTQVGVAGGRRLVLWMAGYELRLAEVSADLQTIERRPLPEPDVVDPSDTLSYARLVSGEGVHMVLVDDGPSSRILALLLDADGSPRGGWLTLHTWDPLYGGITDPRAVWDGERFAVVWADKRGEGQFAIQAIRVGPDGELADAAPIEVGAAEIDWPGAPLAAPAGGVLWVAWNADHDDGDPTTSGPPDLVGVRVDADGSVLDAAPVLLAGQSYPAAMAGGGDQALLVGYHVDATTLAMRAVDEQGPLGEARLVPLGTYEGIVGLFAAPAEGGYLLVDGGGWPSVYFPRTFSRLTVHTLGPDGAPLGRSVQARGVAPVAAYDGVHLFVAAAQDDSEGDYGGSRVHLRRLALDGETLATGVADTSSLRQVHETVCLPPPLFTCSSGGGRAGMVSALLIAVAIVLAARRRHA